jgi:hypothetical protein
MSTFLFSAKRNLEERKTRTVLVAGAKTSFFTKVPAALFLLKRLAENFLTFISRLLPTHCAMVQEGCRMQICNKLRLGGQR